MTNRSNMFTIIVIVPILNASVLPITYLNSLLKHAFLQTQKQEVETSACEGEKEYQNAIRQRGSFTESWKTIMYCKFSLISLRLVLGVKKIQLFFIIVFHNFCIQFILLIIIDEMKKI